MASLVGTALGTVMGIAIGVGILALIACAYLVPVNILRIARHLRGVREQLDRIATALERNHPGAVDEFRELELARRRRPTADSAAR